MFIVRLNQEIKKVMHWHSSAVGAKCFTRPLSTVRIDLNGATEIWILGSWQGKLVNFCGELGVKTEENIIPAGIKYCPSTEVHKGRGKRLSSAISSEEINGWSCLYP